VRGLAVPAGLALVAMLVFFGLVRPALKAALAPRPPAAPGATLTAVVDDEQVLPALPAPQSALHLAQAKTLAKENPAAVAGIVRGWVSGEAVGTKA
jgi:flagellar M-ring protein FliF